MEASDLKYLLDCQKSGYSLEQAFYISPDIFRWEWESIWKKYWLFAGTSASIPTPGDYFTYTVGKDSIIVIRGDDHRVYGHYNTCRHRGSLICLEEKGHAPKLMCPYHQWVYDKDGSLLKARLMPEDFDRSGFGLQSVNIQEIGGLIFICLSQDPPDFSAVRRDYEPFLKPYGIGQARVAFEKRYELRTNWKLIAENFRECYHCGPAHPEYCRAVIGANLRESAADVLRERRIEWAKKGLEVGTVNFIDD